MNISVINNVSIINKDNKQKYTDDKSADADANTNSFKEVLDQMKESKNRSLAQTDEQKKAYDEKLNQKIKSGAKLTASEMIYIRQTNPTLYMKVVRIQMKRDMMEQKLKNCKSKKEVADVVNTEIGSISEKDPDREPIINAIHNVTTEFKKTMKYKGLPEIEKENKDDDKQKLEEFITNNIDIKL